MTDPKISIIMNCHNGEKYLRDSIESIINQSFRDWELIFFDNFSNDNSLAIINSIKDKRIRVIHSKKFLKLYDARNEAISCCNGQYVSFLDTDDLWEKNKLEEQINFLDLNKNYSMVYSNFYIKDEIKKKNYVFKKTLLPSGNITKIILRQYTIGILTTCIRRDFFKTIRFNKEYEIIGDFDFFTKLSLISNIGCIQKPLSTYRIHNNNYSKKKSFLHIKELERWILENKKIYNKLNISLFNIKIVLIKLKIKYFLRILGV